MSEDKKSINSNDINEIVISNPIGDEFFLKKVTEDKLGVKKKYREVFVSDLSLMTRNVSQMVLQVANQGMTLAQIAKLAPNGLYTATANPIELSKFANGTVTTMVRDASNRLVEHAGFAEVGMRVSLNPAILLSAGMQVMSTVSGTIYLHKINAQMIEMDTKLEKLLNLHHDINIGRLIAARKGLSEITNREFVDVVDLSAIRNYKKTANEIHEEYVYRLKRQKTRDLHNEIDSKDEKKVIEEINFTMTITFEASKLSLFAELIEIGVRMKIGDQIEMINGLIKQLKLNYAQSFYHHIDLEVERVYSIIQKWSNNELTEKNMKFEKALYELTDNYSSTGWGILPEVLFKMTVVGKSKFNVSKINKKVESENTNLNTLKSGFTNIKKSDGIDLIIDEIVELLNKEIELIYIDTENEKKRIFVPVEGGE